MTSSRKVGLVNEVKKKTLFRYLVLLLRIGIIKIARIGSINCRETVEHLTEDSLPGSALFFSTERSACALTRLRSRERDYKTSGRGSERDSQRGDEGVENTNGGLLLLYYPG